MKHEYPPVYRESRAQARRQAETQEYKDSFQLNVECARAIERAIQNHANESTPGTLSSGSAQSVLEKYGFHRVQFVLANSLTSDDAVSCEQDSFRWAWEVLVPRDKCDQKFKVQTDRSLLAQFLQQTYAAYQAQGLFGSEHCGTGDTDYTGKVLVLRPDRLKESCLSAQHQLWYGQSGFGLSPTSSGRAVYATCLGDGEKTRLNRSDFIGVLDEQYLPDWAQEKLTELRTPVQQQEEPVQEQDSGPVQGGMEMR